MSRCDNFQDCEDVSDEKNCILVHMESEKYLKSKTPPVSNKTEKLAVEMNIKITEIISIDEVDQIINIQFELVMSCFDSRLKFFNLKENQKMNKLTFEELFAIWVPEILFENTKHQLISQKDEKSFALVMRQSPGIMSDQDINENIEIYDGKQNPLQFFRMYAIDFRCVFDMSWYPFDIQTCTINLKLNGILEDIVDILPGLFEYLGDEELTQYVIMDSKMVKSCDNRNKSIKVSITLGRLLLGAIPCEITRSNLDPQKN